MTMICKICNHNDRLEIDRMLVQGKSISTIARKFNVSNDSLTNHKKKHLSRQLSQAWEHKLESENMSMLDDINSLITRTKDILNKAESQEKLSISLQAIREIRESYKLLSLIAFSLAQAKQEDRIIKQMEQKDINKEESKEQLKNIRERLTEREFDLYLLLCKKIDGDKQFQKEIDIDGYLPHDSAIRPYLAMEDMARGIEKICEIEDYEWCRENGVKYTGPLRAKRKRIMKRKVTVKQ